MNEALRYVGPPSLVDKVNQLIDYYDTYGKPGAGARIPVNATARELAQALKLAGPQSGSEQREFIYRGRVLIATK